MCELLGVSAAGKIPINEQLKIFFSHSKEHSNGWGLALFDHDPFAIDKEAKKALDSLYLSQKLKDEIKTSACIAHIRKATIGEESVRNTHPFSKCDRSGRRWVLAHNGTIFDSEDVSPFQYKQKGSTDSERILLFLVDQMNVWYREHRRAPQADERVGIVDAAIKRIVPGNKVNLMIYDGDLFYVHKNEPGTLYIKSLEQGVLISTQPLDSDGWKEFPQNQLVVYCNGTPIYVGKKHDSTYVYDEEKMRPLYFAYSGL